MADEVRYCGYAPCGQVLAYDGRGRPPEYCPDRRWPGGRTCRQMAAAERAAERAAGLEVPLDTFRAAGERLASVASPLARQLAEVVDAIGQVRDGALTRMGETEQAAQESATRAQAAEEAATAGRRAQRASEAERDRSRAAASEAEQRAETARREADEQVTRAWRQASEADHARGQAEAVAVAATQGRTEEAERREAAEQRAAATEAELRATRTQLDAERAAHGGTRDELASAHRRADAASAELARVTEQATTRTAERDEALARAVAGESSWQATVSERDAARADVARLTAVVEQLRRDLATAQEATTAASQRADRAETRIDKILTSLPAPPST